MRPLAFLAMLAAALPAGAQEAAAPSAERAAPAPNFIDIFGSLRLATGTGARVRLDQDTSLGYPAYQWEFGGNDREFFVFDVVGGSTPLRLAHGYPDGVGALFIEGETGNWGVMGPARASLEIWNTLEGIPKQLLVEELNGVTQARNLFRISNNGAVSVAFQGFQVPDWASGSYSDGTFFIRPIAGGAFRLTASGNVTLTGLLTQLSDRGAKHDVEPLGDALLLERLAVLPLATWRYKGESARHIGPMAQDFAVAFGLGSDDEHVAPADVAGVSLAAARALGAVARALDGRVLEGRERIERGAARERSLQARLERLEARLQLPKTTAVVPESR